MLTNSKFMACHRAWEQVAEDWVIERAPFNQWLLRHRPSVRSIMEAVKDKDIIEGVAYFVHDTKQDAMFHKRELIIEAIVTELEKMKVNESEGKVDVER